MDIVYIFFLSITIELINRIFKKLTQIKSHREVTYGISAIIFSVALCFRNISDIKYIQNVILKYVVIILVFVISLIVLILANLKYKKEKS